MEVNVREREMGRGGGKNVKVGGGGGEKEMCESCSRSDVPLDQGMSAVSLLTCVNQC